MDAINCMKIIVFKRKFGVLVFYFVFAIRRRHTRSYGDWSSDVCSSDLDGHVASPTAVSMLHAGVLMKLGAFGVMRIGMVLVPDAAAWWAPIVGAVAVINILYGA